MYGIGSNDEEATAAHDDKLYKAKCKFCMKQISFFGHLISSEGLQADPGKIKAIVEMPRPKDAAAIQRLNGTGAYLSNSPF